MKKVSKSNNNVVLTEEQLNIIRSQKYPLYVKACAGTGKTETLVRKITEILKTEEKISLTDFAIITFTNKATEELRQRLTFNLYTECMRYDSDCPNQLNKKLRSQTNLVNTCDISTIHSFCESLLRDYGLEIGISSNFKRSSYNTKVRNIINNSVNKIHNKSLLSVIPLNSLKNLLYEIYTYNENHDISQVINSYEKDSTNFGKIKREFIDLYNSVFTEVQKQKLKENVLTINELVIKAVDLLQHDYIKKRIYYKYKYIFIDEYQDTSFAQFQLTKLLIDSGVNVFLVGDDRQAIYEFRGANIENSMRMTEYVKKLNKQNYSLNTNFRSDPKVIDTINKFFLSDITHNHITLKFDKTPMRKSENNNTSEINPVFISYENNIVKTIKKLMNEKTIRGRPINYGDISILCRKNYMVTTTGELCKEAGIPVEVIGGNGFFQTKEIIDIYKFLNYVIYRRHEFKKELYTTDGYQAFENYNKGNFEIFLSNLCEISKGATIDLFIDYLVDNTGLNQYYVDTYRYQAVANIIKLKNMALNSINDNFMLTFNFLEFITSKINSVSDEDEAPILAEHRQNGVITVMSIHKSKGLSFPIVIISNTDASILNNKKFPQVIMRCKSGKTELGFSNKILGKDDLTYNKLFQKYLKDTLEEELRILYVACTRAKNYLVFSSQRKLNAITNKNNWLSWIADFNL